jgi:hypothetical protein
VINAVDRAGNASRVTLQYTVVAPNSASASVSPFVYLSGAVKLRNGFVSVPLGCESQVADCHGAIRLRTTVAFISSDRRKPFRYRYLGLIRYSLARGVRQDIHVPLNPSGRRILGPTQALPTIIVTTTGHGPSRTMTLACG